MREITFKTAFVIGMMLMIQSCYYEYPPESVTIDPAKVSFNTHVLPILAQNCALEQCHDGTKKPDLRAEILFDNVSHAYHDLTVGTLIDGKTENFINTTFPDESVLLDAILNGVGGIDMPPDGALTQQQIDLIRTWMIKGAHND